MAKTALVWQSCELNTFAFEKLAYGFCRVDTDLKNKTFSEILNQEEQVAIFSKVASSLVSIAWGKYREKYEKPEFFLVKVFSIKLNITLLLLTISRSFLLRSMGKWEVVAISNFKIKLMNPVPEVIRIIYFPCRVYYYEQNCRLFTSCRRALSGLPLRSSRTRSASLVRALSCSRTLNATWPPLTGLTPWCNVHHYLAEGDEALFLEQFRRFGKVVLMKHQYFAGRPNLLTGSHLLTMSLSQQIPAEVFIDSYPTRVWYRGMAPFCQICKSMGHKAADCQHNGKCRECGEAGHLAWACLSRRGGRAWGDGPILANAAPRWTPSLSRP